MDSLVDWPVYARMTGRRDGAVGIDLRERSGTLLKFPWVQSAAVIDFKERSRHSHSFRLISSYLISSHLNRTSWLTQRTLAAHRFFSISGFVLVSCSRLSWFLLLAFDCTLIPLLLTYLLPQVAAERRQIGGQKAPTRTDEGAGRVVPSYSVVRYVRKTAPVGLLC